MPHCSPVSFRRRTTATAAAAAVIAALTATTFAMIPGAGAAATAKPAATTKPVKLIYVSPDAIGVNDFLKLGRVGTDAAAKVRGGTSKTFESKDPATRKQNVEAAVREGARVVIVLGFEFNDIIPEVAKKNPKTDFLIVDQCIDKAPANVFCAVFREHEASYLAGAEAAVSSKSGTIGAIGALDIPFLHRYTDAFEDGAKAARPDIKISQKLWVGGDNPFADPVRGEQQGTAMVATGADRILAAGAGSNGGIFKAALSKAGTLTIGVDVNQCLQAPGAVLDNIEKKVDKVILLAVGNIIGGKRVPLQSYGLKEEGLTLTGLGPNVAASKCEIVKYPAAIAKAKALRADIISGKVTLIDPLTAPRK